MKIISVNVGLPRKVEWKGKTVTAGIYKELLPGSVNVRTLNLEGDDQADLSVHGGRSKAVYVYPSEHYGFWRGELPDVALPWGMVGENLSTAGLLEEEVRIGDEFRIGTTRVQVAEPRMPCYKLLNSLRTSGYGEAVLAKAPQRFLLRSGTGGSCPGRRCDRICYPSKSWGDGSRRGAPVYNRSRQY